MKVVNQSIGRSIRHINDYATILLIDRRYCQPKIVKQLPSWLQQSLMSFPHLSDAIEEIKTFFATPKNIT
jgi:chromosome transmission fidelity protein 1